MLMIKYVTFESSSQVQSKTRRLVKFLLELIVKPLAAVSAIFNSVELTFEFRLHSKSHRLNCGHRARNKIKLRRTCILTRFMFLTEQKKLCQTRRTKIGAILVKINDFAAFLELVSKELNHLAAILHVYVVGFDFYEVKKNIIYYFSKRKGNHFLQ